MKMDQARAILFLGCVALGGCVHRGQAPEHEGDLTWSRMAGLERAVTEFALSRGRLPASIDDICAVGAPCELMPPSSALQGLLDEWSQPLVYRRFSDDFELQSAGRDRILNSSDDLVFRLSRIRQLMNLVIGCYQVDAPWWREFAGDQVSIEGSASLGARRTLKPVLPGRTSGWEARLPDSVFLYWAGGHSAAEMRLRVFGDSLIGQARDPSSRLRQITARRIRC